MTPPIVGPPYQHLRQTAPPGTGVGLDWRVTGRNSASWLRRGNSQLGFLWRRQRAAHFEWLAYCRWQERPDEANYRAWRRAMRHYNEVEASRPS